MKNFEWLMKTPVAHRGLHNDVLPENSMSAFKAAIEKGYGIEIDVHLTRDGKLVVFHDFTLKRICGIDKYISEFTADELSKIKLKDTEETIPTLEELLRVIDGKVGLLIEIKYRPNKFYKNISEEVYKMIKDYKGNVAVQSFSPGVVKWFKLNAPEITRGFLATGYQNLNVPSFVKAGMRLLNKMFGAKMVKSLDPDFIAFNILSFPNKVVDGERSKGRPVITWTVNKPELLTKAKKHADNIIFEKIDIKEY